MSARTEGLGAEALADHAIKLNDVVVVDLRTTRQHTIEGTVTGATAHVLILARGGDVVSRIPWPSILTIDTVGSATALHPATA